MDIILCDNRWSSIVFIILGMEEIKKMICTICKFKLDPRYVKYKDTASQPYCQNCYVIIGGRI